MTPRTSGRAGRPIENATGASGPALQRPSDQNGDGASATVLGFGAEGPPSVVRKPLLRLAPLQRVAQDQKRSIAEFLTFTEAASLMVTSKDMHGAIKAHPRLKLHMVSPALGQLGCNDLLSGIRSAEAEISNGRAGLFKLALDRAAHASHGKQRERQVQAAEKQLRDAGAQKARLTTAVQALEPGIEDIVFHFARPRRVPDVIPPASLGSADAAAQTVAPRKAMGLHQAIEDGAVETVRAGLREFLTLSPLLVPRARKLAWLRQQGACTLESSARRCCGLLPPEERRHYEAITAYVDEIVSSAHLSHTQKRQLCLKPGQVECDPQQGAVSPGEPDLVRFALGNSNPAFAASVLLGIHAASAAPQVKHFLLFSLAHSRCEMAQLLKLVSHRLSRYAHNDPEWVARVCAGVNSMLSHWPVPDPTPPSAT